jgi:superfamily II DNA or RNA helicase
LSRFITNQNLLFKELLETYIPRSKQLDFLVGYFFFSGFCGVYKEIADKPLRILVGMDADVDVCNAIRVSASIDPDNRASPASRNKIRQAWYENQKNIISKADSLDTENSFNAFIFFIEKLRKGTLEVRKAADPVHAKMYVFTNEEAHNEGGNYPGKVIVGSSNLSFQGLQGRTEINVTLRDESDYTEAENIFTKLWNEAVPLVDADTKDIFLETVIKRTWIERLPDPYLMYVRVLHEYFKINTETIKTPATLTRTGDMQYMNLAYQTDAIAEGIEKIKRHSGCIIADVVGLGKSIIGAAIAANLNITAIIICPPHLKPQWEEFVFDFGLQRCKIVSSGRLNDALSAASAADGEKLIIVDEAHRYRNENTQDYGLLHKTCIGNKTLLLSATPFNNRPEDVFALIKLFQIPEHSTIQIVNNLGAAMERLIINYRKIKKEHKQQNIEEKEFKKQAEAISSKIRNILQPILIRRTRVDLLNNKRYQEDLVKQHIVFSDVDPPKEQAYDLGDMAELYLDTLNKLTGVIDSETKVFTGARYQPLTYLKNDEKILEKYRKIFENPNPQGGQRNLTDFMRRLLVRRFESSMYSFRKTLANLIISMKNVKNWYDTDTFKKIPLYKKGSLPDFDALEEMINDEMDAAFSAENIDDILEQKLTPQIEKGLIMVNADELNGDFIKDLESDIALFSGILEKWNSPQYSGDPKFAGLLEKIQASIKKEPNRKIIIFSEFIDTVDYLEEKFKEKNIRVTKYTSKTQYSKNIIKANFDAGIKAENQKNDFDVLVATDAISEGFSLHRAGTIYNYDIPYNPTRVIQRVGRINRINKKVFDRLHIYNFFPSATGEALSRTKSITTFKMLLIQTIFGSDTKILTADEITEGYLDEEYKKAKAELESPSWETEYRNELYQIERNCKEIFTEALELPQRCRTGRKAENIDEAMNGELFSNAGNKGVIVFSKKGDAFRFGFTGEQGGGRLLSAREGITLFKSTPEEKALGLTEGFYPIYEKAKRISGATSASGEKPPLSKNIVDLTAKIRFLKTKSPGNTKNLEYLDKLHKVSGILQSLPLYYIKQLLAVNVADTESAIAEFKTLVREEYLDTILEKDYRVQNEVETILLAEQFI